MLFVNKISIIFLVISSLLKTNDLSTSQEFQGKAFYFSKSKMELGAWGARMSEAQKKTNKKPIEE
jgi:hypothetical protein